MWIQNIFSFKKSYKFLLISFVHLILLQNCSAKTNVSPARSHRIIGVRPYDSPIQTGSLNSKDNSTQRIKLKDGDFIWPTTNISWRLDEDTLKLTNLQKDVKNVKKILGDAFAEWSMDTCLTFYEVKKNQKVDIEIKFVRDIFNHSDIVLGHTLFPGAGQGGDIFLNAYVNWTLYPYKDEGVTSLKLAVIHEISHAIGLVHSTDPNSLLYWAIFTNATLTEDDIKRVRNVYHCRKNTPFIRRTTLRPPQYDWPDICNTSFDSALMFRGELMLFKNDYVWRINTATRRIIGDGPLVIRDHFKGLPKLTHIDGVFETESYSVGFFIGKKCYIVDSNLNRVEKVYILTDLGLPNNLQKIDATLVWKDQHNIYTNIYFFSGTKYWIFNEIKQRVESPHITTGLKNLGESIDGGFQLKYGNKNVEKTYVFKKDKFFRFDQLTMSVKPNEPVLSIDHWVEQCVGETTTLPTVFRSRHK